MSNGLIELVEHLPRSRILLLGDLMLDKYIFGNADRLSPEAPVPVLHFQHEEHRLGGAGSVLADLAALRAHVRVVGVLGCDEAGKEVLKKMADLGADVSGVIDCDNRPTVTKLRLVGSAQHRHPQQMIRLDIENNSPIPVAIADKVVANVAAFLPHIDILCLEDYHKGLLTIDVCRHVIELARAKNVPVIVDPANIPDYSKYFGATALKLNRGEAERATGLPVRSADHYQPAAKWLLEKLQLEAVVI